MSELPSGWSILALGQISEIRLGKMLSAKAREDGLLQRPYLRNENVRWGTVELTDLKVMGFKSSEIERYSVRTGDLVICEGGEAGRCAVYRATDPVMYQKAIHRLRPLPGIVLSEFVQAAFEYGIKAGCWFPRFSETTIQHLPLEKITAVEIPIPPVREQQRIVAALDEQLSDLDASVASLERAERNLVRYRAAVLAAACSGKLVPTDADIAHQTPHGARPSGPLRDPSGPEGRAPCYEPADQLLARILVERRKANTKAKYEEPAKPDTSKLPKLPEGWTWATVEQLGVAVTGKTPPTGDSRNYEGGTIPFFKPTDLNAGYQLLESNSHITALGAEETTIIPAGSPMVTCIGATIGKTGYSRVQGATNQQINSVVNERQPVVMLWLYWYFCSRGGQKAIMERAAATTLPILNKGNFEKIAVPLPPLAEQARILEALELHFPRADVLATSIAQAKRRAQRLRRAILAAAFQGRLVPQDPHDEPASVLLERIRAQAAPHGARPSGPHQTIIQRPGGPRSQGKAATRAAAPVASIAPSTMTPKRRGRPPGAKNKAKP